MNKETVKRVEKRIVTEMYMDESELKKLLQTETNDVPEEQLSGLFIKIQQLLGRVMVNQNKLMLLQDITDQ